MIGEAKVASAAACAAHAPPGTCRRASPPSAESALGEGSKARRWGRCYARSVPRLDPDDLRRYAARDWSAPERLARRARAAQSVEERVQLAIALYEAARKTRPGWPDEATRRADLEHHLRLKSLMERAAHVGAR